MVDLKEIRIKVFPSSIANPFVKAHHYSGKVVNNSKLHFGVFVDGNLHGVLSYGPSTDKSNIIGLVSGTGWNEFIELNRMAFDEYLPRNSESYCIAITLRLIKKQAPQIKWVISFADGCSCGDGTIYRASNFVLTGIKKNTSPLQLPDGSVVHELSLRVNPRQKRPELGNKSMAELFSGSYSTKKYCDYTGAKPKLGYQLRYIYFINPSYRSRLTVPEIPFSKIDEIGAGMYKGKKITLSERRESCKRSSENCTPTSDLE